MEKLIRGQVQSSPPSDPFPPLPSPPFLHLPSSVIHSPTSANELILSHTICLQLHLSLRTVPLSLFFPPPERERLFVPTMSPIRCPSIHTSVISPYSLYRLVSLISHYWKQAVKQAALSKWRQALQSP